MARRKKKEVKSFKPKKFEDFEIVDADQHMVGTIRVQPSGIKWAPADAKVWYRVPLAEFARYMLVRNQKTKK